METNESEMSSTSITLQEKEERAMAVAGVTFIKQDFSSHIPQQDPMKTPKKPFKFKVTVFILCLISVVVAMDSVIVAATLPAIAVSLKGTSLEAFWVGTSYLLAQTVSVFYYSSQSHYFRTLTIRIVL